MRLTVRNFRRCERADLDGPIVLIGGMNGNGKSSILTAVALCATSDPVPEGMNRGDLKRLVKDGSEEASVIVDHGEAGVLRAVYPLGKVNADGKPPLISRVAAGFESIAGMAPNDVSAKLGPLIKADPSSDDIKLALQDVAGIKDESIKNIVASVKGLGWDETLRKSRETGTKLKGAWEDLTKEKQWGSNKGAAWEPDGYSDVREADISDLSKERDDMNAALEHAKANAAIDAHELERLQNESAKLDEAITAHDAAVREQARLDKELSEAEEARNALPFGQADEAELPCPHCGAHVQLRKTQGVTMLVKSDVKSVPDAERKQIRDQIATLDGRIARLKNEVKSAANAVGSTNAARAAAQKSKDALDKAAASGGKADVGAAQERAAKAEQQHAIKQSFLQARHLHETIMRNLELSGLLAPTGIRAMVLKRRLADFNEKTLAPAVAAGGWRPIVLGPDFVPTYDGKAFDDLGESHQWIVRTVLQVAIAKLDGSPFVVIDRADVLDKNGRNRLFGMLTKTKTQAIVGMTMNLPSQLPPLDKGKVGAAYWVENGLVSPAAVAQERERDAAAQKAAA